MADDRPATLAGLLRAARTRLGEAGLAEAALDARLLVEHVTGTTRGDFVSDPTREVGASEVAALHTVLERRLAGEPVHRIIGHRDFHCVRLSLSLGTLDPRPDTEALVDLVIDSLAARELPGRPWRILDLGTGTGAIALALLKALPDATATGVDLSRDALETALANAARNGVGDRFEALSSNWFERVTSRYDAIVSNPPYIVSDAIRGLAREVRDHDPVLALDGGADGLDAYRAIAEGAGPHLEPGGGVFVEIGYDQADSVPAVFAGAGFCLAGRRADLGGTCRALAFHPAS
jgi:release factor glutamine methyltransferase